MSEALTVLAVVLGLGVGSVMLGDRLGVPNVLFFVVAGLLVGPHGLDLLHLDAFGDDLATVLGASVAVIVFQDSWEISVEQLTDAPRPAYYLATVGSLVTFAGVAAAAYLLMDVAVGVALLIGALLVATGPTVVEPVLATVDVSERLEHALEIEGLVNEVLAAILAVALFKAVTLQETDVEQFALLFSWHLAAGVVVGLAVGGLVWLLFRIPDHDPDRAPQHARLLLLASSVVAYAAAETLAAEAGIAAAATAGLLLGNVGLEYREHVAQFASDVSTLILGFVFILLSSFAELQGLVAVGLGGLLVALATMFLVRPLAVLVSTARSDYSRREQLFLSAVAPRGIVPAGVATLFAIEIQGSNPVAATNITGTVLLVVLATVVVEGGAASWLADRLDLSLAPVVVVGGGRFGIALADRHAKRGDPVRIVETDPEAVEAARSAGLSVYTGDGTDPGVLREAGADRAGRVVVATGDDETNLAVARLVRERFDVANVSSRVDDADNRAAFRALDVEVFEGSQLELWTLEHLVAGSAPDWLTSLIHGGGVQTVTVNDPGDDVTVGDLDASLPERSLVVALTRDGYTSIPDADETVLGGDRVTLLGGSSAVAEGATHLQADRNAP